MKNRKVLSLVVSTPDGVLLGVLLHEPKLDETGPR
jgi:hypothetical protein